MSNDYNTGLEALFNKMETFVSTKTVVGEPVTSGDVILIPLVDVSFCVGSGAYDGSGEKNKNGGVAGGVGAKITPAAVLVVINGTVQLVNVKSQDNLSKLIDLAPNVLSKFNLSSLFKNKNEAKTEKKETPADEPA